MSFNHITTMFQTTGFVHHTYIELFHNTPGVIHKGTERQSLCDHGYILCCQIIFHHRRQLVMERRDKRKLNSVLTATLQSSAICCEEFTIYGKRVHCTIYMYPLPVGNRQVCIYVMLPSPKCS